jgi:LysR family transcriptional regulator of gallate degradation
MGRRLPGLCYPALPQVRPSVKEGAMQDQPVPPERGSHAELGEQLHNLRVFVFVAEAQSIARGAEQMFKAPAAVARSIAELEKAVGLPLFERKPRGKLLNAYGKTVLARAHRIGAELDLAAAELLRSRPKAAATSSSAIKELLFSGRKLQLLIQLADSRNVSAAAVRMNISQSGASMALSRIESVIAQPLFQRGMQGMVATDVANRLVMRSKRVFAELRHMVSDLSALSGTLTGSVAIGTLPLGRTYIFPMAIARTVLRHPDIHVTTIESHFDQLIAGLRSGDIDAVVGVPRASVQSQGLTCEQLFTDRLIVVARADHPLARRKRVQLAELPREQWILPWSSSLSRTLFETAIRGEGLQPPLPAVESADLGVIRQLLKTTDMLAVASPRQLMFELQSGLFKELPVHLAGMTRDVVLFLREGAMLSPAALALVDAIRWQVAHDPVRALQEEDEGGRRDPIPAG